MKVSPINIAKTSRLNFTGVYSYPNDPKYMHKNSYADNMVGSYHQYRTEKAYYAAPMEPISDSIKDSADYIVYDNEPSYPSLEELKQTYLNGSSGSEDYRDDFEEIRKYYYRREMGGFANKTEAQYQQWQAAECTRLYDKAGDVMYKRNKAQDAAKCLYYDGRNIARGIETTTYALKKEEFTKAKIDNQIAALESMKKAYSDLHETEKKLAPAEYDLYNKPYPGKRPEVFYPIESEYSRYYRKTSWDLEDTLKAKNYKLTQQKPDIQAREKQLLDTIDSFKAIRENCIKSIEEMKNYIKELTSKKVDVDKEMAKQNAMAEDFRKKMVPLFDEIKNFYLKQGIKVIKRG